MYKLLSVLLVCISLLSASLARAEDGVTPNRVVIGQNITLQGGKNDYGAAVLAGMETYFSNINRRGGINGRQIDLITLDDHNKSDKAEANARQLVEKDKAFVLSGALARPRCAARISPWFFPCVPSTAKSFVHS